MEIICNFKEPKYSKLSSLGKGMEPKAGLFATCQVYRGFVSVKRMTLLFGNTRNTKDCTKSFAMPPLQMHLDPPIEQSKPEQHRLQQLSYSSIHSDWLFLATISLVSLCLPNFPKYLLLCILVHSPKQNIYIEPLKLGDECFGTQSSGFPFIKKGGNSPYFSEAPFFGCKVSGRVCFEASAVHSLSSAQTSSCSHWIWSPTSLKSHSHDVDKPALVRS